MVLQVNIAVLLAVCWAVAAFASPVDVENRIEVAVGNIRFPTAPDLWGISLRISTCLWTAAPMRRWFATVRSRTDTGLFRKDLVEKLKAIRPSFMRFPGGVLGRGREDEGGLSLEGM